MDDLFRIGELAGKAGVSKRTVHYYINRGLLPPAHGAGVTSSYSEDHLYRLLLIKKLQEKYLPLEKIREMVTLLNTEQVRAGLEWEEDEVMPESLPALVHETEQEDYRVKGAPGKEGREYIRYDLGAGVELLCPKSLSARENKAVERILALAGRILRGEE
jgi:DNA-binding transcriptional MerR regulator